MKLHEYQAKALLREHGIAVPEGRVAFTADEAVEAAKQIPGSDWVVKAQVHAGGRGKAGGIKRVSTLDEVRSVASQLLGSSLVTQQSGPQGQPVTAVLIEQPAAFTREMYLSVLVDRARERIVLLASDAGGMDIEDVAAREPNRIFSVAADLIVGLQPFHCRNLAFQLGLPDNQLSAFTRLSMSLYSLFTKYDLSLLEINPLAVTTQGELLALDAKFDVDENSLFRQKKLAAMRDPRQEDARELAAMDHGLNYVTLRGNIGCLVNGAGLAMATMDLIKLHGGDPANFLDVGGGTTAEKVAEALRIILSDDQVEAILVNIFGGIVRCDLIAEGIISAAKSIDLRVPIVVRLEGTNAQAGRAMLEESGLRLYSATGLAEAAKKAVNAARGKF